MKIIKAKDYDEMSKKAANIVAGQVFLKPDSILGLATGSTPLLMYMTLVKMHKLVGLDFDEIVTFNLDEYIGLPEENENSYHYYMYNTLFNHINIKKDNIFIPDGISNDAQKSCIRYEDMIRQKGGIDLQVLGIGNNGHIGFNEPDLKFESLTHIVKLDDETINANSRFFPNKDDVPKYAITMGIKTIMHAKKILLLANGESKAEAIFKTINGPITPETPASILQLHQDVTLIIDDEAAQLIK